jgi:hypothetical protein
MKALETNDFVTLCEWCKWYHKYSGVLTQPLPQRFLIGQYQIFQARQWGKDCPAAWQGYAAAAMHFIMVAETMELAIDEEMCLYFDRETHDLRLDTNGVQQVSWGTVLDNLCGCAQMLIYYDAHSVKSNRKTRYSAPKTQAFLGTLARAMLALIPRKKRAKAFYDEMLILTRDIARPI